MQKILNILGLIVKTCGDVLIDGRVIRRKNLWLSPAKYNGLLTLSFNITKVARLVNGPTLINSTPIYNISNL